MPMKVVYIAGPFRGQTVWDVAENVRVAERVALDVARLGAMPLCPHANTAHFDGLLSDQFWIDGTLELLKRCDAVMTTQDWARSTGARGEVAWAVGKIPVFHRLEDLAEWMVKESTT